MRNTSLTPLLLTFLLAARLETVVAQATQDAGAGAPATANQQVPNEWVDPDTGHRVIRLSRLAGSSSSFYFHQNSYTKDGDLMVFSHVEPGKRRRLYTVNLRTNEIRQITDQDDGGFEVVAPKGREVFYLNHNTVYATHLDTCKTRTIATMPAEWTSGRGFSVNADETLLVGCAAIGEADFYKKMPRAKWFTAIFEAKLPNLIYTIDTKTGEIKVIYRANDWLGHLQFSPTDPALLMFCHEGPWERLDRIWLIRADGTGLRNLHKRTVKNEILGHEFWSRDGRFVWYDHQIPMRENFFLGGTDLKTGQQTRYKLTPEAWSGHYNISHSGEMFAGDGNGPPYAVVKGGKWIYLFKPQNGELYIERLCNMARNDYTLEPGVSFTPDDKWVVFRSNMHGQSQVYAVEVAKSKR